MANVQTVLETLAVKLPLVLPTVVALLAVVLFQIALKRRPLANIPLVGPELGSDAKRRTTYVQKASKLYFEAYKKFKDTAFRIVTPYELPVIVVPPKFLDELRRLPDDVVSFDDAIEHVVHAKYTNVWAGRLIPHTVKASLTPALFRLNPAIADEVEESIRRELPPCHDWTSVNINRKLLRIVALVSGRVFVGTEIGRTEEYLDAAINYTVEVTRARAALNRTSPWMRSFVGHRLPEVKEVTARLVQAHELLRPVVEARRRLNACGEKPDDMLQWIMDGQDKFRQYTTEELARFQLSVTFAAIHTTTMTATKVFYNLAAYPQYISDLRDEIRSVLAEHNNAFSSAALQAMKKLDSFIKETMRLSPSSAVTFQRKVNKTFSLPNGQVIPAGVMIECMSEAVSRDPEVFSDADKFDPWRFSRLREQARARGEVELAAQNQFVSINPKVLTFGFGRHSCPGRFFAANEIKMIVADLVLAYDMKLPEGVTERYPNIAVGASLYPDPTKEILLKRI